MKKTRGVCVVTTGIAAERAFNTRLRPSLGNWSIEQWQTDKPIGYTMPHHYNLMQQSRYAKVTLLDWTPFDYSCYLDADTQVYGDLQVGFDILADGWDMVITPSENQGDGWLWHIPDSERQKTKWELGEQFTQLQAGVFFVAKNARTRALWVAWRAEWLRYEGQDQGALLRAFYQYPVKVWLLGRPWNGGAVIGHHFGSIRR